MRKTAALFIMLLLTPIRGHAVLGETADTRVHAMNLAVTKRTGVPVRYIDHQEQSVVVREYAGPDNKVFAVKWRGGKPNLAVLLGQYQSEYNVATAGTLRRIPRRGLAASSSNLEILQYGPMSDIHGHVILKNHLPPNVSAGDLP